MSRNNRKGHQMVFLVGFREILPPIVKELKLKGEAQNVVMVQVLKGSRSTGVVSNLLTRLPWV